ncbi:MAG: P-loop NTPase fold protein [Bacteroidota bacterium]|nr:P-loop NTPase fold protein [Bacteroidota bacterium]
MWNDCETNSDFIDYQHYVNSVVKIIDNDELLPCSIGVFGDWGSGKSSLMKMVQEKYEDESDVLVIKFNGWLFEGYEDTKTVLMGSIIDAIIDKRTLTEKAIKLGAKILRKIDIIKASSSALKYGLSYLTMGNVGIALASSSDLLSKFKVEDYESYIIAKQTGGDKDETTRSNIQEFHKNFEDLITETKIKKLIVLIDDLDRCSTDTILGTLEAIKLFLFTSKTAFILGADERLIKYAVRKRFPEIQGDATEVGRDYLEKLIQYPIRIPPLSNIELTTYINLMFAKLYLDVGEFELVRENVISEKNKQGFEFVFNINNANNFINEIKEEHKESLLLSSQITPVLSVGLNGNPRQCKRFLNTLLLRHDMAISKGIILNKRLLAKLMLLEYFKPETFKLFYESQLNNKGIIAGIENLEGNFDNQKPTKETRKVKQKDEVIGELTIEQESYLQDEWLYNWFRSEPSLKNENLQPYYYFSRDRLTISGTQLQRMSPAAQEVFRKITVDSETIMNLGFQESKKLNTGDAAAIFEGLTEKINQQGKQSGENSMLKRLFEFCKMRQELISQIMIFIENLPEQALQIGVVTWIIDLTKDTAYLETAKKLIQRWSNSKSNTSLAKISKEKLKQI